MNTGKCDPKLSTTSSSSSSLFFATLEVPGPPRRHEASRTAHAGSPLPTFPAKRSEDANIQRSELVEMSRAPLIYCGGSVNSMPGIMTLPIPSLFRSGVRNIPSKIRFSKDFFQGDAEGFEP